MADSAGALLVATRNQGKLAELRSLLSDAPNTILSLVDVGIDVEVEETGSSLEENAVLKARTYAELSALPTLADDSGLKVDALGGEPGHLASRYAGEGATDAERIAFLLSKLDNIHQEPWTARVRCVIAVVAPGKPPELYSGECPGRIVRTPRGVNGFGYDPIFLLPQLGRTMAELTTDEKNGVSHRSIAAQKATGALATAAHG